MCKDGGNLPGVAKHSVEILFLRLFVTPTLLGPLSKMQVFHEKDVQENSKDIL